MVATENHWQSKRTGSELNRDFLVMSAVDEPGNPLAAFGIVVLEVFTVQGLSQHHEDRGAPAKDYCRGHPFVTLNKCRLKDLVYEGAGELQHFVHVVGNIEHEVPEEI